MKNILITGVAGFIGSHLAEKLIEENFNVVGIDNFDPFYDVKQKYENLNNFKDSSSFTFFEGDICDYETLKKIPKVDIVIHLAAKAGVRPSIENPDEYVKVNIQGTLNILNWVKEKGVKKMIFASSSSIYGNNTKLPFAENDFVDHPISPYAFTKKACELMNYTYHDLYNIDIINLRFFTVYGPRQRPDLAIRKFTKQLLNNESITVFGDGSTSRDYTFVGDIVSGIQKAMEYILSLENVYDTFNIGNSYPVKLLDLIQILASVLDKKPKIEFLPMQAGDVETTYADISKAKNILHYNPQTSLKEGFKKFVEWYKALSIEQ